MTSIAIDPNNNQRIFAVTIGGVWRSLNGARRWERVSEGWLVQVGGSVAVDPADGNEIVVGTGDPNYHGPGASGGIYRSTTGGGAGSWTKISSPELDFHVIYKLIYDAAAPNNIYAATSAGVYLGTRGTGGAITFARLGALNAWVNDMAVDFSATTRKVYAAVREPVGTFVRGVWKYDGTTWGQRDSGITTGGHTIAIAIAPSAPQTLYVKLEDTRMNSDGTPVATTGQLLGVFKTTTGGETPTGGGNAWTLLAGGSVLNDSGDYSWYNSFLAVDPNDANTVWGGALHVWRTTNGGGMWADATLGADPAFPAGPHADTHALAFDPMNSKIVYLGNDGGIDRSTDTSLANWSWRDVSHNIVITEFYHGAAQWEPASILAGGSQDNGTEVTFGNRTWYNPGGCDGSDVAIDAQNASTLYNVCNGRLSEIINPVPGTTGGSTVAPLTLPVGTAAIPTIATDTNLLGRAIISLRRDVADPPAPAAATWDPISLGRTTDGLSFASFTTELPEHGYFTTIAIAPSSSFNMVYAGVADAVPWADPVVVPAIWRKNGAAAWQTASTGLPAGLPPTGIAVDYSNANRAFAAFGGAGAVAVTKDGGSHWHTINGTGTTALPGVPVLDVAVDPSSATVIYAATTIGVFRGEVAGLSSDAPTATWAPFNEGLPQGVDVTQIDTIPDTGFLNIATYGHGAYERDINPGAACPTKFAHVRDNVFDRGYLPSPFDVADPSHPIADASRPPFYKPDDLDRLYWWTSPDIKIDVPSVDPAANTIAEVDHVAFDSCPSLLGDCPQGTIIDSNPVRGQPAKAYVQVINRGTASTSNVRVMALWADATTGLPLLPANFWTTAFPADPTAACGAVDPSSGWQVVDPAHPCQTIPTLTADQPEVLKYDWTVPMGAAEHSCMLVLIESVDQPLDPNIRATNERALDVLVPGSNQIALRNLHVVDSGAPGGTAGGAEGMGVPNPTRSSVPIDLVIAKNNLFKGGRVVLVFPAQAKVTLDERSGFRRVELPKTKPIDAMISRYGVSSSFAYEVTRPLATVRLSIPPGANWKIGLVYNSGAGRPGTTARFTLMAKQGTHVLGGSTYLLRILPSRRFGRR